MEQSCDGVLGQHIVANLFLHETKLFGDVFLQETKKEHKKNTGYVQMQQDRHKGLHDMEHLNEHGTLAAQIADWNGCSAA